MQHMDCHQVVVTKRERAKNKENRKYFFILSNSSLVLPEVVSLVPHLDDPLLERVLISQHRDTRRVQHKVPAHQSVHLEPSRRKHTQEVAMCHNQDISLDGRLRDRDNRLCVGEGAVLLHKGLGLGLDLSLRLSPLCGRQRDVLLELELGEGHSEHRGLAPLRVDAALIVVDQFNDGVAAGRDLLNRLAVGGVVAKERPGGAGLEDLLGGHALVVAIVPFGQERGGAGLGLGEARGLGVSGQLLIGKTAFPQLMVGLLGAAERGDQDEGDVVDVDHVLVWILEYTRGEGEIFVKKKLIPTGDLLLKRDILINNPLWIHVSIP